MWIMLTKKLPTRPSPPKMSIFWSVPWPNEHYAFKQGIVAAGLSEFSQRGRGYSKRKFDEKDMERIDKAVKTDDCFIAGELGVEPNWKGARMITYASENIRVFPHEFSVPKPENLKLYLCGTEDEESSHILVPEGTASEQLIDAVLNGEQRMFYDAALLDGCTHEQAVATALGRDVTLPTAEFPPIGWYKPKQFVTDAYCREGEELEHREKEKEMISEEA